MIDVMAPTTQHYFEACACIDLYMWYISIANSYIGNWVQWSVYVINIYCKFLHWQLSSMICICDIYLLQILTLAIEFNDLYMWYIFIANSYIGNWVQWSVYVIFIYCKFLHWQLSSMICICDIYLLQILTLAIEFNDLYMWYLSIANSYIGNWVQWSVYVIFIYCKFLHWQLSSMICICDIYLLQILTLAIEFNDLYMW